MAFAITGPEGLKVCRKSDITADAAHVILTKSARTCTGNFFIDDVLLYEAGVRDFDHYRVDPTRHLLPDFFVPADMPVPPGVSGIGRIAVTGGRWPLMGWQVACRDARIVVAGVPG